MLRPGAQLPERAAVGGRRDRVLDRLRVHAAFRRQRDPGVEVCVLRRRDQMRVEHAIVADLEEAVKRRVGVGVVLMPRRRRQLGGDDAGRAVVLDLVAVVPEEIHQVLLRGLDVDLDVRIVELRRVHRFRRAAKHADVLLRERGVEPRPVLQKRTAEIEAPVGIARHVIRRLRRHRRGERRQLERNVVGLQARVGEVAAHAAVELVPAALDGEVDVQAAGALTDVVAGRADVNLVEVVEVEVHRGLPRGAHVGDLDAVERPRRVLLP